MKLKEVIKNVSSPVVSGNTDVEVNAIQSDSREVTGGTLFIATAGTGVVSGNQFIDAAIKQGAVAIISEAARNVEQEAKVAWVHVKRSREALAEVANTFYGCPSNALRAIGVTGTNGKTTTTYLVHHIMKTIWRRAGLLGTIKVDDGFRESEATHTTPGAIKMHQTLRQMVDNDCRGVVMEVSSHGLDQKRVGAVNFDVGVFANLTQDHLDYHHDMENYFTAKFSLFEQMIAFRDSENKKKSVAVINTDDPYGQRMMKEIDGRIPVWTYGMNAHCDYKFSGIRQTIRGTSFQLDVRGKSYLVKVPLIGKFNVYNIVSSIAACVAAGMKIRDVVKSLTESPQVPGRMENVGIANGMSVFVDYAHTPNAIENACKTLRELEPQKLITVFGCGGDRDKAKRALMGKAAAEYSDFCIVTSDNPRSEKPESIIEMIESGMQGKKYEVVVDRAKAIETAMKVARPGDIILIAGKGHETYQELAEETIKFDDRAVARRVLNEFRVSDLKQRMEKAKEQERNSRKFERRDRDEGDKR